MSPLELVKLTALMERTSGSPEVKIGLDRWTCRYPTCRSGGRTYPRDSGKKRGHVRAGE